MAEMEDARRELEHVLTAVSYECQQILTRVQAFEDYAGSYLTGRLRLKLFVIRDWITAQSNRLYREHGSGGCVGIFFRDQNGIEPIWAEKKSLLDDKSCYARFGTTVFLLEEFLEIICQLDNALNVNDWCKVLEWLRKYDRSQRVDFTKLTRWNLSGR